MNAKNITLSLLASFLLIGCGGGGTTTTNNNTSYKNIRIEHDNDNDTIIDIQQTFTHNSLCHLTQEAFDNDMDNIFDKTISYIYNSNNLLVLQKIDEDNDGNTENSIDYTYTNGLLTQEHISNINAITTYTYDNNGNMLSKKFDLNGNGVIVSIDTMTYNTQDLRIETRTDQNNDGTINKVVTHVYDSNNNLVRDEINNITSATDTIVDQVIARTYDANNHVLSVSDINPITNVTNSKVTYNYNSDGNMITTNYDFTNDSIIDKVEHYYWAECP